mmetsp:Transcript_53236/g.98302  ORF Transcript_53236/g.98302 Transcript_53236/m.98302 type:complete len:893 (-) Transcript_53236:210-2888(-)
MFRVSPAYMKVAAVLFHASWAVGLADPSVKVKSSPFSSAIARLAWAGSSGLECNADCRQACLSLGSEGSAGWGDASRQRADACVAGCGCGGGSEHLFATSESGDAYISTDAGQTWTDLMKQVPGYLQKGNASRIEQIQTSHIDPRSVVLLTNTSTSWISHDAGNSWHVLKLNTHAQGDRQITAWRWHPFKRDWALAESIIEPARGKPGAQKAPASRLAFYTQDGGVSFKLLAEDVRQCHWFARPGGDPRRVVIMHANNEWSSGRATARSAKEEPVEIVISQDFMASHNVILGKTAPGPSAAVRVFFHYNFIFAVVPDSISDYFNSGKNNLRLWFYNEAGNRFKESKGFQVAMWPRGATPSHARQLMNMRVLYSAEDQAFIYIPAANPTLSFGDVFAVSHNSAELSPILTDVQRASSLGSAAWEAVSGIDGAFLANRVILDRGQVLDRAERRFGQQEAAVEKIVDADTDDVDDVDGNDDNAKSPTEQVQNLRFAKRTYLSLDMGSAWQPLRAPEKGLSGQPLAGCEDVEAGKACLLQLSHFTSSFAAPGLVIGVGNAGVRLSENPQHRSVFLSRNAGISWRQILDGPHDVAILSHGDVILAVPAKSPGTVLYSVNSGEKWETVSVGASKDKSFVAEGLFTHPSHADARAFLALSSEARQGVVVASLDFSDTLKEACKLPGTPGAEGSDFEKWSPADALEDAHTTKRPVCMLGLKTSYVRRRADHACKTGAARLAPLDLRKDAPCECTAADWACDVGYHRAAYTEGSACEPLEEVALPNVSKMCTETIAEQIFVTKGYVKIPGNRCRGGVDLSPQREICEINIGFRAMLRNFVNYNHRTPVWLALCFMLVLSIWQVQRQRAGKGLLGKRKKFEDSNHAMDDDTEREFLIPPGDI